MMSIVPTMGRVSGWLRLAVAGAVVLTALTTATATAAAPAQVEVSGRGTATTPSSLTPGFLLDRGRYITIEVPGATVETSALGINNLGQIVGGARGSGSGSGYLRDARGRITTFRFPGAGSTAAQKVNDRGQVTGLYSNTTDDPRDGADLTGFLRDTRGRYTRIAVPGALTTTAVGVNNRGQVVGQYQTPDRRYHGYVWQRGRFTTIDVPGAAATSLVDINDRGQLLGAYADDQSMRPGTFHGFVLDRGRLTTFDLPGGPVTFANDLNNRGQIVGFGVDLADLTSLRSFLLPKGPKGPRIPIAFPGAPLTGVAALNDRGLIGGLYQNPTTPGPPAATTAAMGSRPHSLLP
jgi:probable HAF family extracellular repeat protein